LSCSLSKKQKGDSEKTTFNKKPPTPLNLAKRFDTLFFSFVYKVKETVSVACKNDANVDPPLLDRGGEWIRI